MELAASTLFVMQEGQERTPIGPQAGSLPPLPHPPHPLSGLPPSFTQCWMERGYKHAHWSAHHRRWNNGQYVSPRRLRNLFLRHARDSRVVSGVWNGCGGGENVK